MKPGKHQRNKQRCQNLSWKVHVPAQSLCMNYVTSMSLLVSPSVRSKQLLWFVQGQGQKNQQKHTTSNFVEFHNHSPLWTMNESRLEICKKQNLSTNSLDQRQPLTTKQRVSSVMVKDVIGKSSGKLETWMQERDYVKPLNWAETTRFVSNSLL